MFTLLQKVITLFTRNLEKIRKQISQITRSYPIKFRHIELPNHPCELPRRPRHWILFEKRSKVLQRAPRRRPRHSAVPESFPCAMDSNSRIQLRGGAIQICTRCKATAGNAHRKLFASGTIRWVIFSPYAIQHFNAHASPHTWPKYVPRRK